MGKGIKMCSAKDLHGRRHTIKDLQTLVEDGGAAPPLCCEICSCAVTFVKRYNKQEHTEVREHIRLMPGSEHQDSCDYNVSGRLKIIAADSDPYFLKEIGEGKQELRLLILHNNLDECSLSIEKEAPGRTSSSKLGIEVKAFKKNRLNSYLRTTRAILKLRLMCADDDSLASELSLKWKGGKTIPWKNFFFGSERLNEAWKIIKDNNQPYPITLIGKVKSIKPYANVQFLNCEPKKYEADKVQRIPAFEISLRHHDASFFDEFPPDTEIVMFGIWKAYDSKINTSSGRIYVNHKLMLSPRYKQQIVICPHTTPEQKTASVRLPRSARP